MRSLPFLFMLLLFACSDDDITLPPVVDNSDCMPEEILINPADGCDGEAYPKIETSIYVLPYPAGKGYPTGLTNCSSSFHAEGAGDEYAFDFNMPDNTPFHAIRSGTVIDLEESRANTGDGTVGNYVHVDHGDNTFALYYHSPPDGIHVNVGQVVTQGQQLGVTGTSGYAGYPHLHLIVVREDTEFPFNGIPISFRNVCPRHTVLKSNFAMYMADEY